MSDYNPELCNWPARNLWPAFVVPAGGVYKTPPLDMTHCGGLVQNFEVALMLANRKPCKATFEVFDQLGVVGVSTKGDVKIGTVPDYAIYSIIVTSGSKHDELCILNYAGGI